MTYSRMRIVVGSDSLASYLQAGGHWMWCLSYLQGLQALGHDVYLLELVHSSGDDLEDGLRVQRFLRQMARFGFDGRCIPVVCHSAKAEVDLGTADLCGWSPQALDRLIRSADSLWNLAGQIQGPLLNRFTHRVFVDVDPGHLQVSALTWDLGLDQHDAFLTVGANLHAPSCGVPTLGLRWNSFLPFVHIPSWRALPDPGPSAPFTSITHWTWAELRHDARVLSISKRDAYLSHVALPMLARRPFELAAGLAADDPTDDRERLTAHGWRVANPWKVASSPERYRRYIALSRAEICCPKPIHVQLRTGWVSDRSVCYLATGRPVLVEETACSDFVPTGTGLLTFATTGEAVEAVAEVDGNYQRHAAAARALAEEYFDSDTTLPRMIEASAAATGPIVAPLSSAS